MRWIDDAGIEHILNRADARNDHATEKANYYQVLNDHQTKEYYLGMRDAYNDMAYYIRGAINETPVAMRPEDV